LFVAAKQAITLSCTPLTVVTHFQNQGHVALLRGTKQLKQWMVPGLFRCFK